MKYTLTEEQLDSARMVGEKYKKIEVVVDGKVVRLGHSKIHKDSKKLITESYPHLIKHGFSTYGDWSCRCDVCRAAMAVYIKPYSVERLSINKTELKDRIMEELKMDTYECAKCRSKTNLEADHIQACNKMLHIDSLKGHLHKPELQEFITAEIRKCQVICNACHKESYGHDRITGRDRNLYRTPWLIKTINGVPVLTWTSAQVIKLLQQLGFQPGDKPRVLTESEWQEYRDYAASIGKPSIPFQSHTPNLV